MNYVYEVTASERASEKEKGTKRTPHKVQGEIEHLGQRKKASKGKMWRRKKDRTMNIAKRHSAQLSVRANVLGIGKKCKNERRE